MKFYDNRFDFLRVSGFEGQFPADEDDAKANESFLLPFGENVVNGSTCYFANTGDLFIYVNIQGTGKWINQTGFAMYDEGENPYYVADDDEPVG